MRLIANEATELKRTPKTNVRLAPILIDSQPPLLEKIGV
jgi:hypothetical protein